MCTTGRYHPEPVTGQRSEQVASDDADRDAVELEELDLDAIELQLEAEREAQDQF